MKKEEERVVWMVVATVATTTAAVILLRRWQRSSERRWRSTQRILHKFASECATPVTKLWEVSEALVVEMKTGLLTSISSFSNHEDNNDGISSSSSSKAGGGGRRRRSKLPMLVSHIDGLPTGDEIGIYYGLTLSGTEHLHVSGVEFGGKLQISRVQLGGKTARIVKQESQTVHIPSHWMVPSAKQELFDCIADGVKDFVSKETDSSIVPPAQGPKKLGFTYSFPLKENMALTESSIKLKSFFLHNTKQLVDEFNSTLARHGVDMRVSAMVEDTVGNLSEDKYYNSEVVATITMGMGTNAAYVELESEFSKDKDSLTKSEKVIDIEWGSFSSSHIPLSEFDVCLDIESSNPGEQMFEKLIAGMYLGEIVRRVLLKMAKETALFGETVPSKLRNPYSLRSPDMAAMHQDTSENRVVVDEKLKDIFGITNSTPIVREVVAEVCDIVAERAARLAGAGIVSILKKLGRIGSKERSVVTIEGGLYQHYRVFRNYLHSGVWEMLGHEWSENVVIQNSIGGSGIEAVFLAASHSNSFQDS